MNAHNSLEAHIQAGSSGEGHSYKEEEEKVAFQALARGGSRAGPRLKRVGLEAAGPVSESR